ncbi:hypothetical protein JTE90_008939 [Oedothorax gibbosus]|uniref:Major facilitator superfamily (MFS) profile domain-containing protein n=1 Tax=Oedothorax gibbosus TaxID=931172 RepID=A0AAV6UND4_9ARAC|nr:hypothetical protein JTE90_008939 [Oedothorax gibbosus]
MTADIEKEGGQQPAKEGTSPKQPTDDIFDLVGGDGLWQRCIFLVVLFIAIPSATHNLGMSFMAPNLDHWCARPEGSNWTVREWKELALPESDRKCSRYKDINVTFPLDENYTITRSDDVISCDAWEYDNSFYTSTVVNQWDLVCDKEWLVSLSKSVFMAGLFFSNLIFGQLADTLGRRPTITACCGITVFAAIVCAFSTSFIMFIVTRFFLAIGICGIYNISFVLMMEVIGPAQRSLYGVAFNFGWCIGFVSLPGIAYVLRDWFWIQITLTAPCFVLLVAWWMLPESPRWLMSKGRVDEAQKTLLRAAKTNGKEVADIDSRLKKLMEKATESHESGETSGTLFDLLRTPGLWQMTLNIYILWFVNAFVYYGLSYNTNELAGNPFVNFAISGAVEFPAYLFTPFFIQKFGRKYPLAAAMIIGGISCLLVYPLPADPWWIGVTVSMIGKFCITCSFAIAYVFTAEIFPTVVRNVGLGSAAIFARFGSILAPFVRELGNATHPVVPQLVFGALAFVSGLLVFLLPETKNVAVPETLDDAASRSRTKPSINETNGHVIVKLSNGDADHKDDIQDDELTTTCPSPKLQNGNGKTLEKVPEEDGHGDPSEPQTEQLQNSEQAAEEDCIPNPSETGDIAVPIENEAEGNAGEEDQKTNL